MPLDRMFGGGWANETELDRIELEEVTNAGKEMCPLYEPKIPLKGVRGHKGMCSKFYDTGKKEPCIKDTDVNICKYGPYFDYYPYFEEDIRNKK